MAILANLEEPIVDVEVPLFRGIMSHFTAVFLYLLFSRTSF